MAIPSDNPDSERDVGESAVELTQDEYEWLQQQLAGVADLSLEDECEDEWEDPTGGVLGEVLAACEEGEPETLQQLLPTLAGTTQGIDAPGPDGDTPLHIACLYGHQGCVEALVAAGSKPGVANPEDGSTPLHDAAAGGYLAIVQLLVDKGGKELVAAADSDGDTPLHNAARGGHVPVVSYLLEVGADPAAVNKSGNTAAQEAEDQATAAALGGGAAPGADATGGEQQLNGGSLGEG